MPPAVRAIRVEREIAMKGHARVDQHRPADAPWPRHGDFIDIDPQAGAVPLQRAGPDHELAGRARHAGARPLGHRPIMAARQVQADIERAVVERIGRAAAPRMGVIG
jgi:hypothetical protein